MVPVRSTLYLPTPQPAEPSDARLLGAMLEMYFAKCFELRRRVAQSGAAAGGTSLTTVASANRRARVAAISGPRARGKGETRAKLDGDPRDGDLTCVEDLPFIKFLHFVGEMIVGDRDKEKLKAMKKAKEGGGPRAAFARSDVW